MMGFDATSLYPSAMWDEKSLFSQIESGFTFKPPMIDINVKAFKIQSFNQDDNESAVFFLKKNIVIHLI